MSEADDRKARRLASKRAWRERNRERLNAEERERRRAAREARGIKPRKPRAKLVQEGDRPRWPNGKVRYSHAYYAAKARQWKANMTPARKAKFNRTRAAWLRKKRAAQTPEAKAVWAAYYRRWRAARKAAGRPVPSGTGSTRGLAPTYRNDPKALFAAINARLPVDLPKFVRDEVVGEATMLCCEGMSVKKAAAEALKRTRKVERQRDFGSIPIEKAVWL